ncbi:serine O-acetyltransferase [Aeromicrobium alkaliterrae]|uniref:Serine acetyltransferase n=1 Tax=Aeromicrobium alkaliterrae TaxID=302168 RepID=A0ABN2K2Y0_9ACTN
MAPADDLTFGELVASDLVRYTGRTGPWWTAIPRGLGRPGLWATLVVRAQQRLHARGSRRAAEMLRGLGLWWVGIDVAAGARIGPGVWFEHPVGIVIGNGVVIGAGVTVAQGVTLGVRHSDVAAPDDFPTIGDGAILGARSTVLGGVTVGAGAVVGAHTLVLHDVAPGTTVVGRTSAPHA